MELSRAVEIITFLADGIDPFSGVALEHDSVFQKSDTIRALYKALEIMKQKNKQSQRKYEAPENTGKAWTPDEESLLIREFEAGTSIREIAAKLQRTSWAINSRLMKMGRIKI